MTTSLLQRVATGDDDAVRECLDRFGGLVFSVALRVVGDRQRAEDVTQQTFISVMENMDRFREESSVSPSSSRSV